MRIRRKTKRMTAVILSIIMAAFLLTPFLSGDVKAAGTAADNIDKSGILQIFVYHQDSKTGDKYFIQSGSGFLISDSDEGAQYVITCDHVAELDDDTKAYVKEALGVSKLNIKIEVVVTRDITVTATISNKSEVDDFAILKLDSAIHQKNAMKIRMTPLDQTEEVYAMGYPAAITEMKDFEYYSEDDVTISTGNVSLVENQINGVPYIQHSALLTAGCSGGPLVDKDGNVVGMNTASVTTDTGSYYYSLTISEVTNALDLLGINYQTSDGSAAEEEDTEEESTEEESTKEETTSEEDPSGDDLTEEPTTVAPTVDTTSLNEAISDAQSRLESDYTEESYAALQTAIDDAKTIKNNTASTQSDIDSAAVALQTAIDSLEEASDNTILIIIIIATVVVVAIIIIIIVLVVRSGKKNKPQAQPSYTSVPSQMPPMQTGLPPVSQAPRAPTAPPAQAFSAPTPQAMAAPQPPQPPVQPSVSQAAATVVGEGAGETSVLGYGTGETTVLGGANQTKATLTRVKTNEKVDIVKQLFRIGKERNKVDYCITNNNSVSRVHADIVFKNGQYYIIDNNSTNYTFVNGQMIPAKQEVQLQNGDRIKFAEEEFLFRIG